MPAPASASPLPTLAFCIEIPRGGLIKRGTHGEIELVSPLPCPFNYGSSPDFLGEDGDPLDVIVLGTALPRGTRGVLPLRARVAFLDAGVRDDKWVCSPHPLRRRERMILRLFFQLYAAPKHLSSRIRRGQPSRFLGLDLSPSAPDPHLDLRETGLAP